MIRITEREWSFLRLLAFCMVVVMAILGVRETHQRTDGDRQSVIEFCKDSNARTADLKALFDDLIRPPRPEDYAFIADQKLREGAQAQAQSRYEETRKRLDSFGRPRDCDHLFD